MMRISLNDKRIFAIFNLLKTHTQTLKRNYVNEDGKYPPC
jgi:hypothetical protein